MIEKSDVGELLAIMSAYDFRTVGETDIEAWWLIIGDLELNDCAQAITEHYREHAERTWPAEIRKAALTIARQRAGQQRRAELEQQRAAEEHAIEATPAEPVDRAALADQLRRLATRGRQPALTRAADPRRDHARMAEAREWVAHVASLDPSMRGLPEGPVESLTVRTEEAQQR